MSVISDVTSTIGSFCSNVSSAFSSATSSMFSTITACFNTAMESLSSAASATGAALKKGWNFTVSTYSDNKKCANIALGVIGLAGASYVAYANRAQLATIPGAISKLISGK